MKNTNEKALEALYEQNLIPEDSTLVDITVFCLDLTNEDIEIASLVLEKLKNEGFTITSEDGVDEELIKKLLEEVEKKQNVLIKLSGDKMQIFVTDPKETPADSLYMHKFFNYISNRTYLKLTKEELPYKRILNVTEDLYPNESFVKFWQDMGLDIDELSYLQSSADTIAMLSANPASMLLGIIQELGLNSQIVKAVMLTYVCSTQRKKVQDKDLAAALFRKAKKYNDQQKGLGKELEEVINMLKEQMPDELRENPTELIKALMKNNPALDKEKLLEFLSKLGIDTDNLGIEKVTSSKTFNVDMIYEMLRSDVDKDDIDIEEIKKAIEDVPALMIETGKAVNLNQEELKELITSELLKNFDKSGLEEVLDRDKFINLFINSILDDIVEGMWKAIREFKNRKN